MRRTVLIGGLVLATALAAVTIAQRRGPGAAAPAGEAHPPVPKTESEKRILETINEIVRSGRLYANVPAADGRMLRMIAEAVNAKQVAEIGTSTGISGLWLAMALEKTGGKLTTFELDPERAAAAREHFKKAGVEGIVTLIEGDAHQNVAKLKGPIDLAFIDAEKEGYVDYLEKLLPLMRPGGVILAHNVNMIADYMKKVTSSPDLDTIVYMQGSGMALSLKKR
jgi:predicted O-methyltransferase YrrM